MGLVTPSLDALLAALVQHLVDFLIIVVVVMDSEYALEEKLWGQNYKPKAIASTDNHLYVIPYRSGQLGIAVIGFVHEIFCVSELVVEDHSQVGVEGGQDGVAVLVPAVVLQQSAIISSLQMLVSSII